MGVKGSTSAWKKWTNSHQNHLYKLRLILPCILTSENQELTNNKEREHTSLQKYWSRNINSTWLTSYFSVISNTTKINEFCAIVFDTSIHILGVPVMFQESTNIDFLSSVEKFSFARNFLNMKFISLHLQMHQKLVFPLLFSVFLSS